MTKKIDVTGHCLCGAVQVEVKALTPSVGACHCAMCRRWGGGPYHAVEGGTEVVVSGREHVTAYESSEWAERCFCSRCGTHLFYRLKSDNQHYIAAGLFGEVEAYVLEHEIFVDERPAYYRYANETKEMTGAEVFAMAAPKD